MTKLPYRLVEILTALKENPNGLKVKEIYATCSAKSGSEIPNEKTVSNLLYSMRSSSPVAIKKVEGCGGVTYFITPHGEELLENAA